LTTSVSVSQHDEACAGIPARRDTGEREKTDGRPLVLTGELPAGTVGDVDIVFEKPVRIAEVQRFALLNNSHICAVGVFTKISNR
jgi:hypothetical protein